jgi:hypothetical protein
MSTPSARYRVLRTYGQLIADHVIEGGANAQLLVNQGVLERVPDDTPLTEAAPQQKQGAAARNSGK